MDKGDLPEKFEQAKEAARQAAERAREQARDNLKDAQNTARNNVRNVKADAKVKAAEAATQLQAATEEQRQAARDAAAALARMRMINVARDTLWELAVDSDISVKGKKYSQFAGSQEVEAAGQAADVPSYPETGLLARLKRKGNYTPIT